MEWVKARRKKGREYPFRLAQGTPLRAAGLAPMDTSAEQYTQWIRVAHIKGALYGRDGRCAARVPPGADLYELRLSCRALLLRDL